MYIWDRFNIAHLAMHHVVPNEAEEVLEQEPVEIERQIRNDENRIFYLGETRANRILFVVVTPRSGQLRVVTAYPAKKASREFWQSKRESDHAAKDANT